MLGRLNDKHQEAIIIGAGFAGLLAAYRLLARGWRVTLYEAQNRAGGLIHTAQTEYGIAEAAAHTIRSSPATEALFQELGIETVAARTKKKYIWRGGEFCRFPLSLTETAGMAARAAFMPAKPPYENLHEWVLHHLGQPALDNLIYPMLKGIYAACAAELSPQLVFPALLPPCGKSLLHHLCTQPHGRYRPYAMAPRAGMTALTQAMLERIKQSPRAQIFLGKQVTVLPDAANVIITAPAPSAAQILQSQFPRSAHALAAIRYAPLIAATVFLDKKHYRAPEGIGVLCAAHEPRRALGILFNSCGFAGRVRDEENIASYTVMLGGTGDTDILNLSDTALNVLVETELQAMLKLSAPPLQIVIHRWPSAIPLYSPALAAAHQILREDFCAAPGRILFGNYTGQISLRGMADSFLM